jgi:hypothetical protein
MTVAVVGHPLGSVHDAVVCSVNFSNMRWYLTQGMSDAVLTSAALAPMRHQLVPKGTRYRLLATLISLTR